MCTRAEAKVQLSRSTATSTLTYFYTVGGKVDARFVIPLSEFGRVSSYKVTIDGHEVQGELLKRGSTNMEWTGTKSDSPSIFGFVFNVTLSTTKRTVVVVVHLESAIVTDSEGLLCFGLPYTCFPRSPSDIRLEVKMDDSIRAVTTPNRHHKIFPVIRGKRAQIHVELGDASARAAEYLFIVQVEIGPPIRPECADPVALLILTSAAAAMLFYGLTNSIVEDF